MKISKYSLIKFIAIVIISFTLLNKTLYKKITGFFSDILTSKLEQFLANDCVVISDSNIIKYDTVVDSSLVNGRISIEKLEELLRSDQSIDKFLIYKDYKNKKLFVKINQKKIVGVIYSIWTMFTSYGESVFDNFDIINNVNKQNIIDITNQKIKNYNSKFAVQSFYIKKVPISLFQSEAFKDFNLLTNEMKIINIDMARIKHNYNISNKMKSMCNCSKPIQAFGKTNIPSFVKTINKDDKMQDIKYQVVLHENPDDIINLITCLEKINGYRTIAIEYLKSKRYNIVIEPENTHDQVKLVYMQVPCKACRKAKMKKQILVKLSQNKIDEQIILLNNILSKNDSKKIRVIDLRNIEKYKII